MRLIYSCQWVFVHMLNSCSLSPKSFGFRIWAKQRREAVRGAEGMAGDQSPPVICSELDYFRLAIISSRWNLTFLLTSEWNEVAQLQGFLLDQILHHSFRWRFPYLPNKQFTLDPQTPRIQAISTLEVSLQEEVYVNLTTLEALICGNGRNGQLVGRVESLNMIKWSGLRIFQL